VSAHDIGDEPSRRDFLYIATGAAGAVGAAAVAWPFIDQMRPDASTLALASIEVDIGARPGMSLTVKWRGKPVFIRNRTPKEVEEAKAVSFPTSRIRAARNANIAADAQATDVDRSAGKDKENWIVMIGSAPISAAFRSARPAISAAGSVPATVRTTTRRAVSAKARRREPRGSGVLLRVRHSHQDRLGAPDHER
jgi:Rieske Fe-S protein